MRIVKRMKQPALLLVVAWALAFAYAPVASAGHIDSHPDFEVPGTGTGPTGAYSQVVYYGSVRNYLHVKVMSGTLESSANATVNWRWVCDGGYFGSVGTLEPSAGGRTLELRPGLPGLDLYVVEEIGTSETARCTLSFWATNGSLRLSNVMLGFWNGFGGGGPLPTPSASPSPSPSSSPPPPDDFDVALHCDSAPTIPANTPSGQQTGYTGYDLHVKEDDVLKVTYTRTHGVWNYATSIRIQGAGSAWSAGYTPTPPEEARSQAASLGFFDSNGIGSSLTVYTTLHDGPTNFGSGVTEGDVRFECSSNIGSSPPGGVSDYVQWDIEVTFISGPTFDGDEDSDGCSDLEEERVGSDPEVANPTTCDGSAPSPDPNGDTDGDGFSDQVEAGAGTDPNDPGDYPGGFGGQPPPPTNGGNGGFDVCGAQYSANDKALCEEQSTYAPNPATIDPSGVQQLVEAFGEKAPFGYAVQAGDAIAAGFAGAAGGGGNGIGSDAFGCFEMPVWFGPTATITTSACVPLQEWANKLAPIRYITLAILLLTFGYAMLHRSANLASA